MVVTRNMIRRDLFRSYSPKSFSPASLSFFPGPSSCSLWIFSLSSRFSSSSALKVAAAFCVYADGSWALVKEEGGGRLTFYLEGRGAGGHTEKTLGLGASGIFRTAYRGIGVGGRLIATTILANASAQHGCSG